MSARQRRWILVAALAALALLLGVGLKLSASASEVGSTESVFKLALGSGPGQIKYMDASYETEPWGPISFAMLSDGNVAILDSGNSRILVVNREGQQMQEISYEKVGLISPMDIVEWEGKLAVVEANVNAQLIVLIDRSTGCGIGAIELPSGLAEQRPSFLIGQENQLQLVVGGSLVHLVADKSGTYSPDAIARNQPSTSLKGFGTLAIQAYSPEDGKTASISKVGYGPSATSGAIQLSGINASWVEPLGVSGRGNLLARTSYIIVSGDEPQARSYVEEREAGSLAVVGYASIPVERFKLWPVRYVNVSDDGALWCMVASSDGVSFERLVMSSGQPTLAILKASSLLHTGAQGAWNTLADAVRTDRALADGAPGTPWTRTQGDDVGTSYYSLWWVCGSEAYYQSCGIPGYEGWNGNRRPRFKVGDVSLLHMPV